MSGYVGQLGFLEELASITGTIASAAGAGLDAWQKVEAIEREEDRLKLEKRRMEAQLAELRAERESEERYAASVSGAPSGGVPWWAWALGAAGVVGAGVVVFGRRR